MTDTTTTTETPETEPETTLERKTCGRCGGCGRYSWCQRFGSVCFGCGGSGTVLTKRGHAAAEYLQKLLSVPASTLVVGDIIRAPGLSGGGEPFTYWAKITATTATATGVQVETHNGRFGGLTLTLGADELVRKSATREVKKVAIAKALEFQATLTASGKPVRLKKDGTPYAARVRKPKDPKAAPVVVEAPAAPAAPSKPGRVITAQYAGVCRDCGRPFPAGAKILWSRDHGTTCVECPSESCQACA